jgi:DNA-binding response OmpR family regulator
LDRILCIDDSEECQILVGHALKDYEVVSAMSLSDAQKKLGGQPFALVLVDITLPDGDGIDAIVGSLRELREKRVPFFILTSHADLSRKVSAFAVGADDFITKPFEGIELRSRVAARIERQREYLSSSFQVGDLVVDMARQRLSLRNPSKQLDDLSLTSLEFRILLLLAQNRGQPLPRAKILTAVWGDNISITDRTVDTHIAHLRRKMVKSVVQIETIQNSGYCLQVPASKDSQR